MISAMVLERPGRWRWIAAALVAFIFLLPILPLIYSSLVFDQSIVPDNIFGHEFLHILYRSVGAGGLVGILALVFGWPLGICAGLYRFPGRPFFLGLFFIPLILPTFLWAIGLSNLMASFSVPQHGGFLGHLFVIWSFLNQGASMIFFAAFLAVKSLTKSQRDSLRIFQPKTQLFQKSFQFTLYPVLLAAVLVVLMSSIEPGPGQIFGVPNVGSELMVSFSALYDFALSTRQCILIAMVSALAVFPVMIFCTRSLTDFLLAKDSHQIEPLTLDRNQASIISISFLFAIVLFGGLPIFGLISQMNFLAAIQFALSQFLETFMDSLIFSAVGAGLAVLGGASMAILSLRQRSVGLFLIGLNVIIFSLPTVLFALGLIAWGTKTNSYFDTFFRGPMTVCILLGLHLMPIAFFFLYRKIHLMSPTWTKVAALNGQSFWKTMISLYLPFTMPALLTAFGMCGLLSLSEVTGVILLRPPGTDSFVSRLFTVMANAPESKVAAMCFLLLAVGSVAVFGSLAILSFAKRRKLI